ncbi:MAG: hypothetical protein AAGD25_06580 [Cyanobacteria bacterium P01_F01_bin.150]
MAKPRFQISPFSEYDDTFLMLWAALHGQSKSAAINRAVTDWVELHRQEISEQIDSYARLKGISAEDAIKRLLNEEPDPDPDDTKPK